MSGFEIIERVIARIEKQCVKIHGDQLDMKIKEKLGYLSDRYRRLHGNNSAAIDYGDAVTQFCYVYKYVAAHADYLFKIFRQARSAHKQPFFQNERIRVACVGGDPGSDILAILKYLEAGFSKEIVNKVVIDVYDKEKKWLRILKIIVDELQSNTTVSVNFVELDVSDPEGFKAHDFSKYQLVTSSFFVSEIRRIGLGTPAKAFWRHVVSALPVGAIVVFNDNKDERIYGYFDAIMNGCADVQTIIADNDAEVSCSDSWKPVQRYVDRLDHRPKRNGSTAFRVQMKS